MARVRFKLRPSRRSYLLKQWHSKAGFSVAAISRAEALPKAQGAGEMPFFALGTPCYVRHGETHVECIAPQSTPPPAWGILRFAARGSGQAQGRRSHVNR